MAILINDNYSLSANKPFDARYMNVSTPWIDTTAAIAGIPNYRYSGLTINIAGEEYWWKDGVGDGDLTPKILGGSSNLTGATNGLSLFNAGTNVGLGGNLTGNVEIFIPTSTSFYVGTNNGGFNDETYFYADPTNINLVTISGVSIHGSAGSWINADVTGICNRTENKPITLFNYVDGTHETSIVVGTGVTITDTIGLKGAIYAGDYETNFTSRSLVTAAYVTGLTSQSIITASNGLTKTGTNVTLGGVLLSPATMCACDGGSLTFDDGRTGKVGIQYTGDYGSTFTSRSLVDKDYVDNVVGGGSNTVDVCNVFVNYTATTTNDFIGVSGASIIYLPSTPKACQRITVADICGNAIAATITVDGNGRNINGDTFATINTDYGSMTFINNGYCWSAVAFIN